MADKALVTGAGGFIGSHLVERLLRDGYDVRAFVRYNGRGQRGWIDSFDAEVASAIEVVSGDIRDGDAVRQAMTGCSVVFNLAALIAIPYSYTAPRSYVDTNVVGALNILQAARDLGSVRVLQTSTSEVYGTARFVPMDEMHPLCAQSPYAASKIAADQLALSFHRSFGMPVTVVRPFNAYGARQSSRAVIPSIITQAIAGARRIRLGALHPTRDFNHTSDLARGFIALARCDAAVGEEVNLGTGHEIAIGDLLTLIGEVLGVALQAETQDCRLRPSASEVERLCADGGKARRIAGWKPDYDGPDGLRRGLAETAAWFAARRDVTGRAGIYQL